MLEAPFRLTCQADRELVWQHGDSIRYLVISLEADKPAAASQIPERPAHNIAFVIDASSSIGHSGLTHAGEIVRRMVDLLDERDRVSLVSFNSTVDTHLEQISIDKKGLILLENAFKRIEPGKGSSLTDGWLKGAELVALGMAERPGDSGTINRVFVLSDGRSAEAVASVEQLSVRARELERRELPTTCFSVGMQAQIGPLLALDDRGGSWLAVADDARALADQAAAAYLELSAPLTRSLRLVIKHPAKLDVAFVNAVGVQTHARHTEVLLNDLKPGGLVLTVARLRFPRGKPKREIGLTVTARWQTLGSDQELESGPNKITFCYARGRDNTGQEREIETSRIVASAWVNQISQNVMRLNQEGRIAEAAQRMKTELRYLDRYCRRLDGGDAILSQLHRALEVVHKPWREQIRRQTEYHALTSRQTGDRGTEEKTGQN